MRALVSGSTGFSGLFLVSALRARGHEVFCVSQRVSAPGVEQVDLTSSREWARVLQAVKPDHVFHLSGVGHAATLSEVISVNALAAAALLDAVTTAPISGALLFVGSATEYGLVPETSLPVAEDFPAAPRTPYGAAKLAQTTLVLEAIRRGTRAIVARPSNIIGPGVPLFTAPGTFARQLREIELGRTAPILRVGDLGTERDFIDVRDLAETYVALATETSFAGVVNVSSGALVAMRCLIASLVAAFGLRVSIEREASRLRQNEVSKFAASRTLLDRVIGVRSLTPLAQTLTDLVAHEREITS